MKRLTLILAVLMLLTGCGKDRIVTCDHCGGEITVKEDSNITDEWIVFCKECEETLFGDNPVVSPG